MFYSVLQQPGEFGLFLQGLVTLGKMRLAGHPHHISPLSGPERCQSLVVGQGIHLPYRGSRAGTSTMTDSGCRTRNKGIQGSRKISPLSLVCPGKLSPDQHPPPTPHPSQIIPKAREEPYITKTISQTSKSPLKPQQQPHICLLLCTRCYHLHQHAGILSCTCAPKQQPHHSVQSGPPLSFPSLPIPLTVAQEGRATLQGRLQGLADDPKPIPFS